MDPILTAKLEELRKLYPDEESGEVISDWEKALKKSSLFLDLKQHAAFKIITDNWYAELLKINKELKDNRHLFETSQGVTLGLLLHERRRFIRDFLRPFELAKAEEASIRDSINKKSNQDQNDQP